MTVRDLPAVDALADELAPTGLPRVLLVETARHAIATTRAAIRDGDTTADAAVLARREAAALARLRPQRVINATGVLLHTNLGRAPLHPEAADLAGAAATGYGALELDLAAGQRGGRAAYTHSLVARLTGGEAALVVNNNAGALLLALAALGGGGRVVVSRGELIEIGGSFRLPELMAAAGVRLVEVGTTNRTRLADYAAVAGGALLLKVHPSNYRVEGFTAEAGYAELAGLARERGIPLVADLGSGLLDERVPWLDGPPPRWLAGEPAARQVLEAGAAVVTFSGDKLLGGPQAGVVAGEAGAVQAMARHPIARALRTDGTTLAALAVTLELYADGRGREVPFWRMASLAYEELEDRARSVVDAAGVAADVVKGVSVPGAGSIPGATIPSPVVRVAGDPDGAWRSLLDGTPPVVARRRDDALELDLRAVDPSDDQIVAAARAAAT